MSNSQKAFGSGYGATGGSTSRSLRSLGSGILGSDPWGAARQTMASNVLLGAHLPNIFFIVLVGLFTYASHMMPVFPWLFAVLGGIALLVCSIPTAAAKRGGRTIMDWLPTIVVSLSIVLGIGFGRLNQTNFEAYVHAEHLNHYTDVLPDTDPLTVSDAGVLYFSKGAMIDTSSAVGFHAWPNTYCAAPIVQKDSSSDNSKVGFWAVGMNCCDPRGSFSCDDAGDSSAHSGLLVESHITGFLSGHDAKEKFKAAVRMSAATYDLQAPEAAVLVAWLKDPLERADWKFKVAGIVYVVLVLLSIGACFSLQMLFIEMGRIG